MRVPKRCSRNRRRRSIESNWRVPLSDLNYGTEEAEAVSRVLASGWLSMGPEVSAFEQEFAHFLGVRHAVAVSSATAALHVSYLSLNVGPGDEVIQPAVNFVAAANMTAAVGAVPVFADIIGLDEPTIDPDAIEQLITERTKAVVAMHYGGYLCRMAPIRELCRRHGLALIEDACHAVGAYDRTPAGEAVARAGALGDVATFSFFSNKNLATGEGGMVVTNRADLADRLRLLRSHGMTSLTWDRHRGHASSYNVVSHGYNYRLDELHAALGRVQLKKLVTGNARRKKLVEAYWRELPRKPGWIFPFREYEGDSGYHLMVAVAPDTQTRARVVQELNQARIQTSLHYPCIPDFSAFSRFGAEGLEDSRSYSQRVITLPLFPRLTLAQVSDVCTAIGRGVVKGPDAGVGPHSEAEPLHG
jgi:dTDP-4-amino-4,6-dideoxygalactose transaminase